MLPAPCNTNQLTSPCLPVVTFTLVKVNAEVGVWGSVEMLISWHRCLGRMRTRQAIRPTLLQVHMTSVMNTNRHC